MAARPARAAEARLTVGTLAYAGAGTPACCPARSRSTISSAPSAQPRSNRTAAKPIKSAPDAHDDDNGKTANQSIRVAVDTLERLMTMVSELVLTRNQLLDIVRRHDDSEFKAPLQRLSNVTAELQDGVMKTRMQPIGNAWQKVAAHRAGPVRRARQADRAGYAGRRNRARPSGARSDQGSAHAYGAQFRRPRIGKAG